VSFQKGGHFGRLKLRRKKESATEREQERKRESAHAAFQWAFQARRKKKGKFWAQIACECESVCESVCMPVGECLCVRVLSSQMIEGVAWQKWQTMLKALTTAAHALPNECEEGDKWERLSKKKGERKRERAAAVTIWRWSECKIVRHTKTRW